MPTNRYPVIAREGWPVLLAIAMIAIVLNNVIGLLAAVPVWVLFGSMVYLFRDPPRNVPASPLAIVSPVHGTVIVVDNVRDQWLQREAQHVQIKMSFVEIFSLRSPIEGKLIKQWSSRFKDDGLVGRDNQQHAFWIQTDEQDDVLFAVTAPGLTSPLRFYVNPGERVGQGQRCGYLYFGGVVDVLAPVNTRVSINVGDKVIAGSSVLAQLVHESGVTVLSAVGAAPVNKTLERI